jgi:hypothetical protein
MLKEFLYNSYFEGYLDILYALARMHFKTLKGELEKPPNKRFIRKKKDRSAITWADIKIAYDTFEYIKEHHTGISINTEEIQAVIEGASEEIHIDPVDPTNDLAKWDPNKPNEHNHASVMLSLTYQNKPAAFALAIPLREEIYWGSINDRIRCGNDWYKQPKLEVPDKYIIGLNDNAYPEYLETLGARRNGYIASVACRLAIMRAGIGGSVHVDRPYEANCIAAAALSSGATRLTDEFGNPYLSGEEGFRKVSRLIWSYDPLRHEEIQEKSLKYIRRQEHA